MTDADAKEAERRFRGSWAPLIRDPARFSYTSLTPAALALEKATETHEKEVLTGEDHHLEEEEKSEEPPPHPKPVSSTGSEASSVSAFGTEAHPLTSEELAKQPYAKDPLLLDAELAMQRVERLKKKYPSEGLDGLCEILIQTKCKQGALVGLCSAGPAMLLPGWGSLASVLLGSVADITLTTKLEVDLALEIACLYGLWSVYCAEALARRAYLLHVAGLEGLEDGDDKINDDRATREAGERLAVRATEEAGKASLLRFVPVLGATVGAGTNVVGIYVIGRRAQLICKGEAVGTWRESVNKYMVPADISRAIAFQISRVPSAVTVKVAQMTTRLGVNARRLVITSVQTSPPH